MDIFIGMGLVAMGIRFFGLPGATHDLKGKVVLPFNTNGGYGVGSSFRQFAESCTDCNPLEGFTTRGGSERDGVYLALQGERREEVAREVEGWLSRLNIRSRQ